MASKKRKQRAKKQPGQKLTVITTHVNADFDAFASMLAAQKIYPDALVVFPGSQEASLRNFFVQSMAYLFNLVNISDIDLEDVDTLVLVDTRQPSRIGRFAEILDKPDLSIHLYDHHPDAPGDVEGDISLVRPCGATASILTHELQRRGITLAADEATVLCLGIYEDTGSFTFSSTTQEDFLAAAILVELGANLNMVASLISREISPQQISLLNEMIQSTVRHNIHGIEVTLCTVISEEYVGDLAFLVHKLKKMENLDVLFCLALLAGRVYLVARSRVNEVNVGRIVAEMGGGGHRYAASATIKNKTLPQVEAWLLGLLDSMVEPRQKASDIMSSPAINVPRFFTIRQAQKMFTQFNINALVVTEDEEGKAPILGIISRQVVEKALHHQLDEVQVQEYMTTDPVTIQPDADLAEIQKNVMESKQRLLPVMKGRDIAGVVTRTDLLNILVNESYRMPEDKLRDAARANDGRTRQVNKLLSDKLPPDLYALIRTLGRVADEMKVNAYVVGGFVRDLYLLRDTEDVDVVVEGDGIAFAKTLAKERGGRVHTHEEFGTAVVLFPDGFRMDVASARFEYYDAPASLPVVQTSSLKLDLYRRDFTINTMAIQLNAAHFGSLIDFFGAQRDIKQKNIQVLHNLSFVEDPTRVFRAIRFEQRFDFTIGKLTSGLIENAVKMDFFKQLSGRRLFAELKHILEEAEPLLAVRRMEEFDLLPVIGPCVRYSADLERQFISTMAVVNWYDLLFLGESYKKWAVHFLALLHQCDDEQILAVSERLELTPRRRKIFVQGRREANLLRQFMESEASMPNSRVHRLLSPMSTELLLYMMASTRRKTVKQYISTFFTHLQGVGTLISGKDLKKLGEPPGPAYSRVLHSVLDARLDGKVKTFEQELDLARELLAQNNQSQGKAKS